MKKLVLIILIVLMLFAVSACEKVPQEAEEKANEIKDNISIDIIRSVDIDGRHYFLMNYFIEDVENLQITSSVICDQTEALEVIYFCESPCGYKVDMLKTVEIGDGTKQPCPYNIILESGKTYTQTITVYVYGKPLYKAEYEIGGNDEDN